MWCKSCRVTGYTHCAHPDECGNMVTLTAAADSWKSWLDDAPLPETFNSATGGLQDFITALSRALLDARAELARVKADAAAAMALVVERAAKIATRHWEGEPEDTIAMEAAIRALASVDGLAMVQELRAEIADLKMNMDADLRTMVREGQQLRTLAAELAAAQQREAELLAALEDPLVVHLNMVAGKIAKPLPSQLAHIYGEDVIRAALAPTPTDPGDGWTWNERLGWIGPDGKPADPRRRG